MTENDAKQAAAPETTAEWVEESMVDVLSSYSEEERDKTLPVILLFMAREFGWDNLQPKILNGVQLVLISAGIRPEHDEEKAQELLQAHVDKLEPNMDLLMDIKKIFDKHYEALGEDNAKSFNRMTGKGDEKKAPMVGDKKPEGALNLDQLKFPKRL